jgi:hypothetical protein
MCSCCTGYIALAKCAEFNGEKLGNMSCHGLSEFQHSNVGRSWQESRFDCGYHFLHFSKRLHSYIAVSELILRRAWISFTVPL